MNTDNALMVADGLKVAVTAEAVRLKDEALAVSALVGKVTNDEENNAAAQALKALKAVTRDVEKARKAVKEPFLDACRQIDEQAKTFVAELSEEEGRVLKLSADYATEQARRMREIEAARQREAARIERERLEAESKIRAEEQKRLAEAQTAKEAERIRAEFEAKQNAERERAAQALEAAAPAPVVTKPEGVSARQVWDFEVTDVWTLARLHPGLVTVTPNRREILDVIASGVREIKGLRIFEKTAITVRTAGAKPIDV